MGTIAILFAIHVLGVLLSPVYRKILKGLFIG